MILQASDTEPLNENKLSLHAAPHRVALVISEEWAESGVSETKHCLSNSNPKGVVNGMANKKASSIRTLASKEALAAPVSRPRVLIIDRVKTLPNFKMT